MPILNAHQVQQKRVDWLEILVASCERHINQALIEGRTEATCSVFSIDGRDAAPVFPELFADAREILVTNMAAAGWEATMEQLEEVEETLAPLPQGYQRKTVWKISWRAAVPTERETPHGRVTLQ